MLLCFGVSSIQIHNLNRISSRNGAHIPAYEPAHERTGAIECMRPQMLHIDIYILSAVKDLEQEEEEVFLQQFKYIEISYGNREIRMMISSVDAK